MQVLLDVRSLRRRPSPKQLLVQGRPRLYPFVVSKGVVGTAKAREDLGQELVVLLEEV
jgi:hypothetical protein